MNGSESEHRRRPELDASFTGQLPRDQICQDYIHASQDYGYKGLVRGQAEYRDDRHDDYRRQWRGDDVISSVERDEARYERRYLIDKAFRVEMRPRA